MLIDFLAVLFLCFSYFLRQPFFMSSCSLTEEALSPPVVSKMIKMEMLTLFVYNNCYNQSNFFESHQKYLWNVKPLNSLYISKGEGIAHFCYATVFKITHFFHFISSLLLLWFYWIVVSNQYIFGTAISTGGNDWHRK